MSSLSQEKKSIKFFKIIIVSQFKGATKLYSTFHVLCIRVCVVIILFNGFIIKVCIFYHFFEKLVVLVFLRAFRVFYLFCVKFVVRFVDCLTLHNHCLHSDRRQVLCVFVLTYLKQFVKKKLTIALNKKHASR